MSQFIEQIITLIEQHKVKGLVVDDRFNTGGDAGVSSPLVDQVRAALTAARKNRDGDRTLLYSTLLSDFGNAEIHLGHALSEAEALDVVQKAIKRRRESVEAYQKAGRQDLADRIRPVMTPSVTESAR